MLIPCPPHAVHALYTDPPVGPPHRVIMVWRHVRSVADGVRWSYSGGVQAGAIESARRGSPLPPLSPHPHHRPPGGARCCTPHHVDNVVTACQNGGHAVGTCAPTCPAEPECPPAHRRPRREES